MKKITFFIIILPVFPLMLSTSFADCKVQDKINECNAALKDFTGKDGGYIIPGESIRSIEDFVCLQASPEKRAFQILMGENFREIDLEMDKYLQALSDAKGFYFGKEKKGTFLDGINNIYLNADYFEGKYYNACVNTFYDALDCVEDPSYTLSEDRRSVSIKEASQYIEGSGGNCYRLTDTKIEIFKQVAYNIMLLNQNQVANDEKKLYDQEIRTKYDKVLDLMMINIGYVERIRKKWPSKTKNVY